MDDCRIIELYWERNEDAISESAKKYASFCSTIAHHILLNQEDVEECVNDTWLGAWNTIPPHRPNYLRFFLGKITRNISYNKFKSRYTNKRGNGQLPIVLEELHDCISDSVSVEKAVEEIELEREINQYLHSLPERECNVFLRRYWYVESIQEIADRYDMTIGYVKVMLSRTRKKLRLYFEKEGIKI